MLDSFRVWSALASLCDMLSPALWSRSWLVPCASITPPPDAGKLSKLPLFALVHERFLGYRGVVSSSTALLPRTLVESAPRPTAFRVLISFVSFHYTAHKIITAWLGGHHLCRSYTDGSGGKGGLPWFTLAFFLRIGSGHGSDFVTFSFIFYFFAVRFRRWPGCLVEELRGAPNGL